MPAGGFRTFIAGETLDETKINDYLMQGVLVFQDSGARGSAIGTPVHGMVSFLKDQNVVEYYGGTAWESLVTSAQVDYLVIAAGGSGNSGTGGGGGGAGGYRSCIAGESSGETSTAEFPFTVFSGDTLTVTIGAGGASSNGSPSLIQTANYKVEARGGGRGDGQDGGSGAGGAGNISLNVGAIQANYGLGSTNQGYRGGGGVRRANTGAQAAGGGGGGAGGVGGQTSGGTANGGIGLSSSVTGSSIERAGGGAGGYAGTASGGGGTTGVAGTANTGGGGGGGSGSDQPGGSGVVFLRYPDTRGNLIVGTGLAIDDGAGGTVNGNDTALAPSFTPTGYKVYMFKSGTGTVTF